MILTFAEDFSSDVTLDSELLGTSSSGLYFNRGTHPIVTVNNVLSLLPSLTTTFAAYNAGTTYSKFETSRKKVDIVSYESKIYQSIADANLNNLPTDTDYWLETNLESLKIKSFAYGAKDNLISAISLNRKLIENQYIYNLGETEVTLEGDYSGWVFEPKGSDYVKIRINQIAIQAMTTDPISLYVVNQGVLIDTLTLTPLNGVLSFENVGYTISGKGAFTFAFESQAVKSDSPINDPLKYNGFVCYPVKGTGDSAAASTYERTYLGNGLNFNVTAYLDSDTYIENNFIDLAKLYQSQFTLDFMRVVISNANTESNSVQRILGDWDKRVLANEINNLKDNTIARQYQHQLTNAKAAINKTFDNFIIDEESDFEVEIGVL